jgi:hypothetical protein
MRLEVNSIYFQKRPEDLYAWCVQSVYTTVMNMVLTAEKVRVKAKSRTKHISIRVGYSLFNWIKKNNFSATKILVEACRELGYNQVIEDAKMTSMGVHKPRGRITRRRR